MVTYKSETQVTHKWFQGVIVFRQTNVLVMHNNYFHGSGIKMSPLIQEMYLFTPFLSNQMDDLVVAKGPITHVVVSLVLGYKTTQLRFFIFIFKYALYYSHTCRHNEKKEYQPE